MVMQLAWHRTRGVRLTDAIALAADLSVGVGECPASEVREGRAGVS
jgi:hypothetical protein